MKSETKIILGVAGVGAVIGAIWYFSKPVTAQPVYQTYHPALSPGAAAAAQTTSEINAAAQGANALANLASSVSDLTSGSDASAADPSESSVYDPSLSGLGGLYGRE